MGGRGSSSGYIIARSNADRVWDGKGITKKTLATVADDVFNSRVGVMDTNIHPGLIFAEIRRKQTGNTDLDFSTDVDYWSGGDYVKPLGASLHNMGIKQFTISAESNILDKEGFFSTMHDFGFEKAGTKKVKIRDFDKNGNPAEVDSVVMRRR